ncbi:MAG: hypothetical protein ACLR43_05765 [Faecalibacillus faecis]
MVKAITYMDHRNYVIPDDIKKLFMMYCHIV